MTHRRASTATSSTCSSRTRPTLPDLREYLDALYERRQFMVALAKADLRSLAAGTALGGLWSVLDPLFQAAIYYFLYVVLRGRGATRRSSCPS